MKHIRLFSLLVLFRLIGIGSLQAAAQQLPAANLNARTAANHASNADPVDMTDQIVNPSFESSFEGWTNNGMATQGNDGLDPYRQGNTYIEKWVSSPPLPDVSVSQTIANLPNGTYTLTAGAQNISQDPFGPQPGAFIFGNNAQTEVQAKGEYSVDFLVVDGTATIGFKTKNSLGNWTGCDHFRLLYRGFDAPAMQERLQVLIDSAQVLLAGKMKNTNRAALEAALAAAQEPLPQQGADDALAQRIVQLQTAGEAAKISVEAYAKLQAAVDAAKQAYGSVNGEGAATLLAVLDVNEALANNFEAELSEILAAPGQIDAAILAYKRANASDDAPLEMTEYIANPSFESSLSGWNNNGMQVQGNDGLGAYKQGNLYVEKWVGAPPLPNVSVSQVVTGLPNGKYTLMAAGQNITQNPVGGQPGAFIFGNDGQKEVGVLGEYAVDFLVIEGKATIGFKTENSQGNWAGLDNFRLQFKGYSRAVMQEKLQSLVDSAQILLAAKMKNSDRNAVQSAVATAQQPLPQDNPDQVLTQRIVQLQTAIASAVISIDAYRKLQAALDSANSVYGDGSGNQAAVLRDVIDINQALANNLDAELSDVQSAPEAVYAAILAFRVANSAGTPPVVTTDPRFARGATMAFGRSTISGVSMDDLREHGFCYGTNPDPTIFDQKTTKSFWNNGLIYRIENLQPATVYYIRAYAIGPDYAVGYGDAVKVITIPQGNVTYQLEGSVTNSGENYPRIASAVESGVFYYNHLTSITGHHLSVNYNAGTPTAEASYGGYMQFGANPSYQRTGTTLHEMNHTVGVGQHWIWYGPSSPLREGGSGGRWLGERANKVLQFLDNNPDAFMTGDGVHMWPYGINGAHEDNGSEFLYTANALITQGLGEDGLPPTGGFASPAYTFDYADNTKYYIKVEDDKMGLYTSFLVENEAGQLVNKPLTGPNALNDDHAAWYFQFNPATGYYQIKNAATGKFFTYQGTMENGIGLGASNPASPAQSFQLMGARYNTSLGDEGNSVSAKAYWIVSPERNMSPPTLAAKADGTTGTQAFDFTDAAKAQRWLLLSAGQVESFQYLVVDPAEVRNPHVANGDGKITLTWDPAFGVTYDVLRAQTADGNFESIASNLSATRHADAVPNGNANYYKIVGHNEVGSVVESGVLSGKAMQGQQAHYAFDENQGTRAYDDWGAYHGQLKNGGAWTGGNAGNGRTAASKPGSGGVILSRTDRSYVELEPGLVSTLSDFTIATWVKLPENLDDYARLFDFGTGTGAYMAFAPKADSNIFYQIRNSSADYTLFIPHTVPLNKWVHLAISQNGTTFKVYLNGALIFTDQQANLKPSDLGVTNQNYLGRSQWGHDPYSDMAYEDFSIYNYALSDQQITALVQESPLPVKLISFEGKATNEGNRVSWRTAEEIDNDYFAVERASGRPVNFQVIGKIKGNGTTSVENRYDWLDSESLNGISYYRLKQVDIGGQATFSRIIAIDNRISHSLNAYPNPTSERVVIELPETASSTVHVRVFTTGGRLVLEDRLTGSNEGRLDFNMKALPTGLYQLNIISPTGNYHVKVVKK
ncbi:LamG-like jellyroll fold domain-containing protein [Dyadobacter sp. OTU695]|uniref:LamG-like jellyroll fold domain-containing protein n=1 Tax=Dyadobacter sp. OTU695 TaxID=3043860 RepID=UPI00313BCB5D